MERWCGVFMENLQHCQKAGTFRSFEERSGSDAFILYLPSLQECLNFVCPTITFEFCVSQFSVFEFGVAEGWAGGTTQWRFRLYYITCTEDSCHMFHPVPGKLKLFICVCKNGNILAVHYFLWDVLLQASGEGGSTYLAGMDSLVAFKAARVVCELLYHCVRRSFFLFFISYSFYFHLVFLRSHI